MNHLKETVIKTNNVFDGNVIKVENNTVKLPNGKTAQREIVYHQGAVCIIATDDKYMYFVKQYRIAPDEILLEIPAGKIEIGEHHIDTARKELKEEIGGVGELELVHEFYVSPGFSNERVYLYECNNLTIESQSLEEDEFLDIEKIPLNELHHLVNSGRLLDAKTLVGVQHYLLNHFNQ